MKNIDKRTLIPSPTACEEDKFELLRADNLLSFLDLLEDHPLLVVQSYHASKAFSHQTVGWKKFKSFFVGTAGGCTKRHHRGWFLSAILGRRPLVDH